MKLYQVHTKSLCYAILNFIYLFVLMWVETINHDFGIAMHFYVGVANATRLKFGSLHSTERRRQLS